MLLSFGCCQLTAIEPRRDWPNLCKVNRLPLVNDANGAGISIALESFRRQQEEKWNRRCQKNLTLFF
jgi:hypothetical protein